MVLFIYHFYSTFRQFFCCHFLYGTSLNRYTRNTLEIHIFTSFPIVLNSRQINRIYFYNKRLKYKLLKLSVKCTTKEMGSSNGAEAVIHFILFTTGSQEGGVSWGALFLWIIINTTSRTAMKFAVKILWDPFCDNTRSNYKTYCPSSWILYHKRNIFSAILLYFHYSFFQFSRRLGIKSSNNSQQFLFAESFSFTDIKNVEKC